MKIIMVPINEIKPYWRNPRKNKKTVEVVKASIEKFGFNVPLLLDTDNIIITGHSRYKALLEMGKKEAACIISDMPKDKSKAFRIVDNKTSEYSEWDYLELEQELREIIPDDIIDFFPDLDIILSKNISPSDLTSEDIDKKENTLHDIYKDKVESTINDYSDIICPYCQEEFSVSISEINRNK